MDDSGIVELLAEMVQKMDQMVSQQAQTNLRLDKLEDQQSKTNLAIGELRLSVMKLADGQDELSKRVDGTNRRLDLLNEQLVQVLKFEARIDALEKAVFKG